MIIEIVFAAGCFWGVEKHFESFAGVIDVTSGYTGGNYDHPTYEDVLKYRNEKSEKVINHTEAVKVVFDNSIISADTLIKSFWELHDPTQINRQGNDVGNNYRTALFFTNEKQKSIALDTKNKYQALLTQNGYGKIVTQIQPLGTFWDAENYHQDYLTNNPDGYCPNHSTGIKFDKADEKKAILPLKGKEILVVESEYYCPFCEQFDKEISSSYSGSVPLRTVIASQLKMFNIKTELTVTPTILFINNADEIDSYQGFMDKNSFYKALDDFKILK